MGGDVHHLQIRASLKTREKIIELARRHNRSTADIVRSALDIGLKLLDKLLESQADMVNEYIRLLKKDSRLNQGN
jgi:hypothetical protein